MPLSLKNISSPYRAIQPPPEIQEGKKKKKYWGWREEGSGGVIERRGKRDETKLS